MPQKWYNMHSIDMSENLPMRRRTGAKVRYSVAYLTGRERIAKRTFLPCGPYSITKKEKTSEFS